MSQTREFCDSQEHCADKKYPTQYVVLRVRVGLTPCPRSKYHSKDLGGPLPHVGMYGVFDGHGGREVAAFCQQHMPQEFLSLARLDVEVNVLR